MSLTQSQKVILVRVILTAITSGGIRFVFSPFVLAATPGVHEEIANGLWLEA